MGVGMFDYKGLKISWLGHDCFKIKDKKTVYFDPYQLRSGERADVVFITHDHFDHCSPDDVRKVASETTVIVTTPASKKMLTGLKVKEIVTVKPGDRVEVSGIQVEVVPAYNTNKFRSPNVPFHPKQEEKVGFIATIEGVRVYHAGDTDHIPEMKGIKADLAFLPVSGMYVMTAAEAVEAAKEIKPKLAIPMHYGSIAGNVKDAEKFKRTADCPVQILEKE